MVDDEDVDDFMKDAAKFYSLVENYTVNGEGKFKNVRAYLLGTQVLPLSNTFVEHVFSVVMWLKNKY